MKNRIRNLIGAAVIGLSLFTITAKAQTFVPISLPFTYLTNSPGTLGGFETNIFKGWTNIVYVTNTLYYLSNYTTMAPTNIIATNVTVTYGDISSVNRPWVVIQSDGISSTATSNLVFKVAKTITGSTFDTNNLVSITNVANAVYSSAYQLDMRGYSGARIWSVMWLSQTGNWTNSGLNYSGTGIRQAGSSPYGN